MASAEVVAVAQTAAPEHPLRNRYFRLLWMGNLVSWMGDQFYLVALPWLILQLTGSAVALGTVMMAAAIPRAALMLIGGVATDRVSGRLMIVTAWLRTLLVARLQSRTKRKCCEQPKQESSARLLTLRRLTNNQRHGDDYLSGCHSSILFPSGS